jgi:hypothetical protein
MGMGMARCQLPQRPASRSVLYLENGHGLYRRLRRRPATAEHSYRLQYVYSALVQHTRLDGTAIWDVNGRTSWQACLHRRR